MYISIDLDDTLLHTDKSISDYTLKVLKECQRLGHYVIINTARNKRMTLELMDIIKPDFTSINAGAMICDINGECLIENCISKEITNELTNRVKGYCEYFNIQTRDVLYTTVESSNSYAVYQDFSNGCYLESQKVLVYKMDLEMGKKIAKEMGLVFTSYFGGSWSRFSSLKATKLKSLEWIVDYTKGNMKDTISFGDDHGDLEMILGSHLGIAMANSQSEVLEKVKVHCESCNSDGVAKYLEDYFSIKI